MQLVHAIVSLLTNTLGTLTAWTQAYGAWIYGILFLIIFCETGLVVTPFLPGDSLLVAAGVLAGAASLNPWILWGCVFGAALLGDNVNYTIGRSFGHGIIESGRISAVMKPEYIARTQAFFVKHGGKTVVLARFFPIIRTYAPFMAGVGRMRWIRFFLSSVLGTAAWVTLCIGAGVFLGGIAFVQEHFEIIVIAIILVSIVPSVVHAWRSRGSSAPGAEAAAADPPAEPRAQ